MPTRRRFLGALGTAVVGAHLPDPRGMPGGAVDARGELPRYGGPAEDGATDEAFWRTVQQAYTVDRTILNLDNGGVNPAPRIVQEAMRGHLEAAHHAPVYTLERLQRPRLEQVRAQLAQAFGCAAEEVALTRNTTEAMEILLLGLDLKPGDEILTTTRDYWRFLNTAKQRAAREGIVLKQVRLPIPLEEADVVVERFEAAITPRTRVLMLCHVNNLTGAVLPVRAITAMARRRGLPVFVDGAHGFGHLAFTRDELGCDFYATSLHKWLGAPHGTGLLYVRKEHIPSIWPLQPAPAEMRADIRKFEHVGTVPAANHLAVAEALAFYQGLGPRLKEARLRYLRVCWQDRLLAGGRVRLLTSRDARFSGALATIHVDGLEADVLAERLWQRHRILVKTIRHEEFTALRVTPNVYTSLEELERFCAAVEACLAAGGRS